MKRTGFALFVASYIAATIAVAGYRSAAVANNVMHAEGSLEPRVGAIPAESLVNSLPQFSHARKAPRDVAEMPALPICSIQVTARRFEDPSTIEYSQLIDSNAPGARAPPALI